MRPITLGTVVLMILMPMSAAAEATVEYRPWSPGADVMGWVLQRAGEPGEPALPDRANPPGMPGWPRSHSAQVPEEGVLLVQGDGDAELEVLYMTGKTVHLADTDGSDLAGWPLTVAVGSAASGGPAFGDLDGDGEGEVVVTTDNWPNGSTGWVSAFHLDGTPVTGFPALTNGDHCKSPTVVDLDNDGHAEVIVGERDYPTGRVYVFGGDGQLLPGWPFELDHVPAASAGAADIVGDHVKEIVYESYSSIYAFKLDGTLVAGFPFTPSGGETFSYSAPVFADVDGDARPEIAVGGHFGSNGVFLLDGDGSLLPNWPRPTSYWIYAPVTFADLDGDHDLEVIVGDQVLSGTPSDRVYAWHADGTPVSGWPVGPINAINAQVAVADIDGDEDPELVWDDNTGAGLLLGYHHDGTPVDGWPLSTDGTTFFNTAAFADVDLDGDLELAAASGSDAPLSANIYLWDLPDSSSTEDIQMPMFQYGPGRDGLMPPRGLLFADGFESGDTSAWSATIP